MENTTTQEKKTIGMRFQELNKIEQTSFFYGVVVLLLLSWIPLIIGYYSLLGRTFELVINIVILVIAFLGLIIGIYSFRNGTNVFTLTGFICCLVASIADSWFLIVYQYIIYL